MNAKRTSQKQTTQKSAPQITKEASNQTMNRTASDFSRLQFATLSKFTFLWTTSSTPEPSSNTKWRLVSTTYNTIMATRGHSYFRIRFGNMSQHNWSRKERTRKNLALNPISKQAKLNYYLDRNRRARRGSLSNITA